MLCPLEEIREDCKTHSTGSDRNIVEELFMKHFFNDREPEDPEVCQALNEFWDEYQMFVSKEGDFAKARIWMSADLQLER